MRTIQAHWTTVESLIDARYPPAVSIEVLSCLFGFSRHFLGALSRRPENHYRTFRIPKGKSEQTREIHAPSVGLKVVQKWFGHHLAKALQFNDCVYGLRTQEVCANGGCRPLRSAVDLFAGHR